MHSILPSLPTLGGPGSGPSHRLPRRSSSFLSLKPQKNKSSQSFDLHTHSDFGPSLVTPPNYFEAYPKAATTVRLLNTKSHRTTLSNRPSQLDNRKASYNGPSTELSYTFPAYDTTEAISPTTSGQYSRARSRTGPSGKPHVQTSPVPHLRFSGSSSTQHTDTSPHTVDFVPSKESFEQYPVVAVPVSGVEIMDALVDGMNGEDGLLGSTSISNRARFGIPGHHPLYQPPLPTPPPGVILGGGKGRRSKANIPSHYSSDSDRSEEYAPTSRPRRRRPRPTRSRVPDTTTSPSPPPAPSLTHKAENNSNLTTNLTTLKTVAIEKIAVETPITVVPSISDIIRAHAPPEAQVRSRPSTARSSYYTHSQGHETVHEEPEPEPLDPEEIDVISRSSIDSIADEVQQTLRTQMMGKPRSPAAPPSSFPARHSIISDTASIYSPRSDPGAGSSNCSLSVRSSYYRPSPFEANSSISLIKPTSTSREVAEYLRSARLTTLLRLTRSPHASQDDPLTVSFSDLGSPTGYPVVVFLGLGCVRHVMALYDEMAEILNLRLITIDRWGLGRTEPRPKSARGIIQWASVVEEVLDLLHVGQCSIMAHSAGAPYALSFANKVPGRVRGNICLLAPWVGGSESNGYKWLKYVPNGILKTAQAAEWRVQAWMLGKPPTVTYEGIEYNATPLPLNSSLNRRASSQRSNVDVPLSPGSIRRPSLASSTFSEYDDLRDFDGRFESRSTLGAGGARPVMADRPTLTTKRKSSRGFLTRLKGPSQNLQSPLEEKSLPGGRTLKALRSISSLRAKSSRKSEPTSPQLPPSLPMEVAFGFHEYDWSASNSPTSILEDDPLTPTTPLSTTSHGPYRRSSGRRSISFTTPNAALSLSPSPSFITSNPSLVTSTGSGNAFQAALGNALIAASHAEAAKGTHNDLLQILNHENHSWGFSYSSYPHAVKVWYGDKDEKIAENAVKWMAQTMGEDRCSIKIVKGADHGLLYKSNVVVEVLEHVLSFWKAEG